MLNALLTDLAERYHDLGHVSPAIDRMMDQGGGFGHRIEFGHDLDGFLRAYDLDGMDGIHGWADHMLKDFTSPAGIPLPFSEALVHLTPLEMGDAVKWLTVNAADFLELGAEAAAVELVSRRFAENRVAYHVALAAGMALGFADDNPLLVAFSGAKWIAHARRNLAVTHPAVAHGVDASIARLQQTAENLCVTAVCADLAAHALHLADVLPALEKVADGIPIAEGAAHIGEGLENAVTGASTIGIGFIARRAVRALGGWLRSVKQREAARLADYVRPRVVLAELLRRGAAPTSMVAALTEMRSAGAGLR